jgi:phosphoglycolate phosphatase
MKKKKYRIDFIIFDLDGTLVDTVQDIGNSVNYALKNVGYKTLSVEKIMGLIGDGIRNLLKRALETDQEELITESLKYFQDYYRDHLMDNSRLFPDIDKVLKHFSNAKKGIISNKTQEFTDILLKKLEIDNRFDLIIGGQAGFKYKPDPESILYLLKKFDINAQQAVIIGDSINDIMAGKAAEIITCAVTYGYNKKETLLSVNPEVVIDYPLELCEAFVTNNKDE